MRNKTEPEYSKQTKIHPKIKKKNKKREKKQKKGRIC